MATAVVTARISFLETRTYNAYGSKAMPAQEDFFEASSTADKCSFMRGVFGEPSILNTKCLEYYAAKLQAIPFRCQLWLVLKHLGEGSGDSRRNWDTGPATGHPRVTQDIAEKMSLEDFCLKIQAAAHVTMYMAKLLGRRLVAAVNIPQEEASMTSK